MNTVVIIGAGCSKGLANLPTDDTFMKHCAAKIEASRFLKEVLQKLYFRTWPSIIHAKLWEEERLEVLWNEIYENLDQPKIVLKSREIDQWFDWLDELAKNEIKSVSKYNFYSWFLNKQVEEMSPYEYLFRFADWELRKIIAETYSIELNSDQQRNYKKFVDKVRAEASGEGHVYISFNYDINLEQSLPTSSWEYFGINNRDLRWDTIGVVKPHGSLNWLESIDLRLKKLVGRNPIVNHDLTKTYSINEMGIDDSSILMQHSIVPAISKKGDYMDSNTYFNFTPEAIQASMKRAQKLIIVGYSFPIADIHFRNSIIGSGDFRELRQIILVTRPNKCNEREGLEKLTNKIVQLFHNENLEIFENGIEGWIN